MKQLTKIFFMTFVIFNLIIIHSCKKNKDDATTTTPPAPNLVFKFKFDSTQVRLDNLGNPATIPAGNAAQTPTNFSISQHYIELANDFDSLGHGKILFTGQTTTAGGGSAAIDYSACTITSDGVVFFTKPLKDITPGSYNWLRVSLAYQNYNIIYKANAIPTTNHTVEGTIASFIGYKTYITSYKINGHTYTPSAAAGGPGNHLQGYWGFETNLAGTNYFYDGQAPAGATTVPNPNFVNSPVPAGSCVVTGKFVNHGMTTSPLVITGNETSDIVITVSLSINKSFEWKEGGTPDGIYQPEVGDTVKNMGVRGLIPIVN